jgi:hypothetical protein
MNQATHRVGLAAGAVLAGALIPLLTSPAAGADEGTVGDTFVDNSYQAIANFFAPEAAGNMVTADQFSDLLTGEGTPADHMVDTFYQQLSTGFAPEGQVDAFFDGTDAKGLDAFLDSQYQAIADFFTPEATGNMLTADQFSDMLTGEGTLADQMLDGLYQSISTAFAPEGPVDVLFDSLFNVAGF